MATFLFSAQANRNGTTTMRPPHFARAARTASHDGFTLIELLIVVAMIAVLATIAFPIMLRARITANEGTAVASLRTIHSAEASYASTCGSGGYAVTLEDLSAIPPGTTVGFVNDPYVANGVVQQGYYANLMEGDGAAKVLDAANTCNGSTNDAMTRFVAERHPENVGSTGVRSFAIDTQGIVYMRMDGVDIDDALTGTLIFQ
jgi:prepilin-type N-terminal cleavage/methylation domain-containing protein